MADAFTSETYDALCAEAEESLSRGLVEQARELLLKAVSLIGTRPRARSLLADACMALGLWSEAREQLEVLTTLEITDSRNHYRLGQVLEELGDYDLARDNYRVVADSDPSNRNAAVAMARLAGKVSAGARQGQEEQPRHTPSALSMPDVQIYPDVPTAEDVFATTEDIDNLLRDIGVTPEAGRDSEGEVSALLSKVGIDLEPKKNPQSEPDAGKPGVEDLSEMLGTGNAPGGGLEALFNPGRQAAPGAPQAPAAPAAPMEPQEFSLDAIFGTSTGPSAEPAAPAPAPARAPGGTGTPVPAAPGPEVESLDALFGTAEAPEAAVEEAPEAPVQAAPAPPAQELTLEAVFGEPGVDGGPEVPPPAGPATPVPEPSIPEIGTVISVEEEVAGEAGPAEPVPEQVVPAPAVPEAVEAPEQRVEAILESVFTAEVEPQPVEPEVAEAEAPPAQPAAQEAEVPPAGAPEQRVEAVLESIFTGGVEPQPPEPAAVTEAEVPPAGAPEQRAESILESVFTAGVEPQPVEPEVAEAEAPPAAPAVQEAETAPAEPVPGGAPAPVAEGPAAAEYSVHKPGPDELVAVQLVSGELEIRMAFVVCMDARLTIREEGSRRLLGGSGMIFLGQGARVPVVVSLSPGCLVRSDRIALQDSSVRLEEGGVGGLPGLSRVVSGSGSAVLFAGGRSRETRTGEPVKARAGCLLFIEDGVEAVTDPSNPDFLVLRGGGRAVLAL